MLEDALKEQREMNESLRDAQGDLSAYEAELEAQLRDRDAEANQHKEELERLKQLNQVRAELLRCQRGNLPWDEGQAKPSSISCLQHWSASNCWFECPPNGRWYQFARICNCIEARDRAFGAPVENDHDV